MYSWETLHFAYLTSFFQINVARHLWSNLQKCKVFFGGKEFDCIECKAIFKNLNGLNDLSGLNNLSGLNDLYSLISSKNLYLKVEMYVYDGLLLFIAWKRP